MVTGQALSKPETSNPTATSGSGRVKCVCDITGRVTALRLRLENPVTRGEVESTSNRVHIPPVLTLWDVLGEEGESRHYHAMSYPHHQYKSTGCGLLMFYGIL